MRTKKCILTWLLTMALIVMQSPLQAAMYNEAPIKGQDGYFYSQVASGNGWTGLQIGQYCHVGSGGRIRPSYSSYHDVNMIYSTTSSGLKLYENMEWVGGQADRTFIIKKATDFHMAYTTNMKWCLERINDFQYSKALPINCDGTQPAPEVVTVPNYRLYPSINYYGVNYNLDAGSWKESADWTQNDNGIWKSTEAQLDEAGNPYGDSIWFAYDGFKAVLPTAEEVNKSGYELLGWDIGDKQLSPGTTYKLAEEDAQFDANGQHTIDVNAIWKEKSVQEPAISMINLNNARATSSYSVVCPLTKYGFEYRKLGDSEWIPLTTNMDANSIQADLSGLVENTKYQIKGYVENKTGKIESEIATFKTHQYPSINKVEVSNVSVNGASLSVGYVSDEKLNGSGFEYKKLLDNKWTLLKSNDNTNRLTADLSDLQENTKYQVKAYIDTNIAKVESEITTFKTNRRPSVNKVEVSNISSNGASISAGYLSEDALTGQGFRYRKKAAVSDSWTEVVAITDASKLSATLSNLTSNTEYEVKAFIKTAEAETIGDSIVFTTQKNTPSDSGSSSGSGGSSSKDTSSNTSSTTSAADSTIEKALQEGKTPKLEVDAKNEVVVSSEMLKKLCEAKKDLIIQTQKIDITLSAAEVKNILAQNKGMEKIQVTATSIQKLSLNDIKLSLDKEGKVEMLGGSELTLSLGLKASDQIENFVEPISLSIDLSNVSFKDSSKLSFVRYEKQADASYRAIKLGGTYDDKSKTFFALVGQSGLYGIVEADELTQIQLTIGDKQMRINKQTSELDVAPQIIEGKTMLPLRFISETLGAKVTWDNSQKQALISLDGKELIVGKEQGMLLEDSRILVPLRYISEELGVNVLWVPSTRAIQIVK